LVCARTGEIESEQTANITAIRTATSLNIDTLLADRL
jgi:hypothetical protein